ncbi:MAG TPA: hypothetical protein ENJ57_04890, partial [Rhizobiales bacterium]|nr:hypothetical protein [Hyphomicrobiales bacterium]
MRFPLFLAMALNMVFVTAAAAAPAVVAKINKSRQSMDIYVNGTLKHNWKVSTARRGYRTPVGRFRPGIMKRMHYSRKYNNSPMPWSIFFLGGYAIHGTNAVRRLGSPASHGCIRLRTDNARTLFNLVRKYGRSNPRIEISGSRPARVRKKSRRAGKKIKHNRRRIVRQETSRSARRHQSRRLARRPAPAKGKTRVSERGA